MSPDAPATGTQHADDVPHVVRLEDPFVIPDAAVQAFADAVRFNYGDDQEMAVRLGLAAAAPHILQRAADRIDRRAGLLKSTPGDKRLRKTHFEISQFLRGLARRVVAAEVSR